MPLARSSTLCWLLIRLASWATFFSAQLQLENAEIWYHETSGWFFQLSWRVSLFFFLGGGGNFLGWNSPKYGSRNLETNWCLEYGMLMITCVLKVVPEFGQFAAGFLGWSDPYCSLLVGAVIMMRNDVYMVFHVYEYSIYLYLYIYIFLYQHLPHVLTVNMKMDKTPLEDELLVSKFEPCHYVYHCLSILYSQMFVGGYNTTGYFNVSASHAPKIGLGIYRRFCCDQRNEKRFSVEPTDWCDLLHYGIEVRYFPEKFRSLISGAGFGKVCKMLQNCWHLMDALLGIFVWFLGCKGLRKINSQNYGPVENWPCELIFEVDSFSI